MEGKLLWEPSSEQVARANLTAFTGWLARERGRRFAGFWGAVWDYLIQEGEILVCPVTAPSWGPVFGKIKAAVSDIGGTMSHAAIVAREYGMLRVDGDRGVVRIPG